MLSSPLTFWPRPSSISSWTCVGPTCSAIHGHVELASMVPDPTSCIPIPLLHRKQACPMFPRCPAVPTTLVTPVMVIFTSLSTSHCWQPSLLVPTEAAWHRTSTWWPGAAHLCENQVFWLCFVYRMTPEQPVFSRTPVPDTTEIQFWGQRFPGPPKATQPGLNPHRAGLLLACHDAHLGPCYWVQASSVSSAPLSNRQAPSSWGEFPSPPFCLVPGCFPELLICCLFLCFGEAWAEPPVCRYWKCPISVPGHFLGCVL